MIRSIYHALLQGKHLREREKVLETPPQKGEAQQ
jgi:hypothetical protein